MGNTTDARPGGIFANRVRDLIRMSEHSPRASDFLTPSEQKEALDAAASSGAASRCFFWGGAPDAERRLALFLPEWLSPEGTFGGAFDPRREETVREIILEGAGGDELSECIVPLEVSGGAYTELSHRDYLGAVTALGIMRSATGDIVKTGASSAIVFATPPAAKLILSELTSVGRERVEVRRTRLDRTFRIEREYEVITDTVMSCRLDGIVKALCGISRDDAAKLVESGDVMLNYTKEKRTDARVAAGDIISVRGHGKFIFDGDRGVNRRGRLRIDARKYV